MFTTICFSLLKLSIFDVTKGTFRKSVATHSIPLVVSQEQKAVNRGLNKVFSLSFCWVYFFEAQTLVKNECLKTGITQELFKMTKIL